MLVQQQMHPLQLHMPVMEVRLRWLLKISNLQREQRHENSQLPMLTRAEQRPRTHAHHPML